MNVNFKTLGCRLNEAESESWAQQFQNAGHRIVRSATDANLIILNSCAVTTEAGRKSRQMIRRLHRVNPAAKLVVSGCYATLEPDKIAAALGVDMVIPNKHKNQLTEIIGEQLIPETATAAAAEPGENALFQQGRQRAFIKVQDGCRFRCTFCIVTIARGDEKSRPIKDIIGQINNLHQQGVHEVILTGVHLGGYGTDIESSLDRLITAILEQTDIPRVRLGSLEPWDLPNSFFGLFRNPRLMPHLHLPLQSGSDAVLRRMARRCTTTDFMQLADQARNEVPDINLTSDIIVGFPGETEGEWKTGLEAIAKIGFGHLHIFPYSPRAGTKAALFASPVSRSEKKERCKRLHHLAESMKQETYQRYLGRKFPVLWESGPGSTAAGGTVSGYTPNFLRVTASETAGLANTIRPVRLTSILDSGTSLQGEFNAS